VFSSYGDKVTKKRLWLRVLSNYHKSQGSTYTNVGFIFTSFRNCYDKFTRRSLLDVAATRTSKTLYVYDKSKEHLKAIETRYPNIIGINAYYKRLNLIWLTLLVLMQMYL
jgi:ATP-dependent exoDNAse (exonuclease V) alpha subunit